MITESKQDKGEVKGLTLSCASSLAIEYHVEGCRGSRPLLSASFSQNRLILVRFLPIQCLGLSKVEFDILCDTSASKVSP